MLSQTQQLAHAVQTSSFAEKTHLTLHVNTRFSPVYPHNQLSPFTCRKREDNCIYWDSLKAKKLTTNCLINLGKLRFT